MPPRFSRQTDEKIVFPDWIDSQPRTSPCEAHCPAGNPIQKVSTLIEEDQPEEALSYLRSRNPFPGITGRVCAHPCEEKCNRNSYDQAVAIQALERFAAERADLTRMVGPKKRKASGRTVAIIGSGPAGLTCAYFSALFGHSVTVFEAAPVLGGIPRLAIPTFRLPKDVVDREVGLILELGVQARINTRVGRDVDFQSILEDFDACVIAAGTWKERQLDIPGNDFSTSGVTFLQRVNSGWRGPIGDRVVIAGGGGVAFDCAFTAKRLGAAMVRVVCVEGSDNMCASTEDLRMARAEGIVVHNSRMIRTVLNDGTRATGVECVHISSFEFDERGSLSVEYTSNESQTLAADTVILSVGVFPDLDFIQGDHRFRLAPRGTVEVDPKSFATPVKWVFAAGDAVSGPSTVASAIGSGRRVAVAVNRYLGGRSLESTCRTSIGVMGEVVSEEWPVPAPPHVVGYEEILNIEFHEKKERQRVTHHLPQVAQSVTEEIEEGFGTQAAICEANHCFHCGHCTSCGCCVSDCPLYVLSMTPKGPQVAYFDECWHCGCCRIACPSGAVLYEFPLNMLV